MTTPKRIQLRRTKGWRKPNGAIVVTRSTPWGNPSTVAMAIEAGYEHPARASVGWYQTWLDDVDDGRWCQDTYTVGARTFDRRWVLAHLGDLRGHDLACYCAPDQPCHADVLLEIANTPADVPANLPTEVTPMTTDAKPSTPYYGPCNAGHPYEEVTAPEPCQADATEYVSVTSTTTGLVVDGVLTGDEALMRLCADHATQAEQLPGFNSRKVLAPPALENVR